MNGVATISLWLKGFGPERPLRSWGPPPDLVSTPVPQAHLLPHPPGPSQGPACFCCSARELSLFCNCAALKYFVYKDIQDSYLCSRGMGCPLQLLASASTYRHFSACRCTCSCTCASVRGDVSSHTCCRHHAHFRACQAALS